MDFQVVIGFFLRCIQPPVLCVVVVLSVLVDLECVLTIFAAFDAVGAGRRHDCSAAVPMYLYFWFVKGRISEYGNSGAGRRKRKGCSSYKKPIDTPIATSK